MSNTRQEAYSGSDPHADLDYIPRGGSKPAKPSKSQKRLPTGRAGLKLANKIDEKARQDNIERASQRGIKNVTPEDRQAGLEQVQELRNMLAQRTGTLVTEQQVVTQELATLPTVEPGEQGKLFEPEA
jgi:hypothetical protein